MLIEWAPAEQETGGLGQQIRTVTGQFVQPVQQLGPRLSLRAGPFTGGDRVQAAENNLIRDRPWPAVASPHAQYGTRAASSEQTPPFPPGHQRRRKGIAGEGRPQTAGSKIEIRDLIARRFM